MKSQQIVFHFFRYKWKLRLREREEDNEMEGGMSARHKAIGNLVLARPAGHLK